ncbi:MAG: ribosomal rRNA E-loop binding protein Ctc/L25/TL5, large subunit ribosomal protein [Parcubacteria group bacterium]|nr:ribosomal rRNA E-loop binding protein Ctc/L25/TL5, large subunit ribosomal protein [Parcubacteria group bacterium]
MGHTRPTMNTLNATKRTETGKASRTLLATGKMPAVVYGPNQETESITLTLTDFTKILRDEGESTVVEIAGLGTTFQALIQEIDRDPVTHQPRHADFYAIKKGAKVTVSVPLSFIGEAGATKLGASIVKVMHELEVEADPSKLPHEIEIDLEVLENIGDQIHVKDVKLPAGVVATLDGEEVVVLAQTTQEEPEEDAGAPDMDAIEVEQKGKEDGEEGDAEEKSGE